MRLSILVSLLFLSVLQRSAMAAECWQQRAALLDWNKQEYNREIAELRVFTLKNIQQFKRDCKTEIKTFPGVKRVLANSSIELVDAEERLGKMKQADQKKQSNECKVISLRRQYCGLAASYRNFELHTISGSTNQQLGLKRIDQQLSDLAKKIAESSGNQVTKSYCEVTDKKMGTQVMAYSQKPSTQEIEDTCGK